MNTHTGRIRYFVMAAIAVMATTGWGQERDIAFVNMERVFAEYHKTKRADTLLKEQAEGFNAERKAMIEKLRAQEEGFNSAREEAQDQTLSEEARDRKRSEAEDSLVGLRKMENEIREFENAGRKDLEDKGKRMRSRIVDEIMEVVEKLAKQGGLFAVVDSSGPSMNQVPVFLFTEAEADITDKVLMKLNEAAPEEDLEADETAEDDAGEAAASPEE